MPASIETLVTDLEHALEAESTALRARDAEALVAAIAGKQAATQRIADRVRPDDLGANPDLAERLRRCRTQNEAAGGVICELLQDTRAALGLLGVPAEPGTYGHNGAGASHVDRRPLATC